jgi:hypothetical protein
MEDPSTHLSNILESDDFDIGKTTVTASTVLQHRDNAALGDRALHKQTPWWNTLSETTEIN